MRVFVTGASGWIGSAVSRELRSAGHEVLGLARSDESAAALTAAGLTPVRGDIDDPGAIAALAADADGVVHLAYNHDFSDMAGAAATDLAVITAVGDALAGSDKPLLIASGVLGVHTETDRPDPGGHPRNASSAAALALADRGVRSVVVRFAPTVHGPGDHGFTARMVEVARERGEAGYVAGSSWAAVARTDAAHLVRLALEGAPAGSVVHAVGEEEVPLQEVAGSIGRHLDVPVVEVPSDEALDHFGWLGRFVVMSGGATNGDTRRLLEWEPTGPTLLEDLDEGSYFA